MRTYRQGAVGALTDEYERAAAEFAGILEDIPDDEYECIRDTETRDEDCRSIRTVVTHVVRAGYGYAEMLREAWGIARTGAQHTAVTRRDARDELESMLEYTRATLEGSRTFRKRRLCRYRFARAGDRCMISSNSSNMRSCTCSDTGGKSSGSWAGRATHQTEANHAR